MQSNKSKLCRNERAKSFSEFLFLEADPPVDVRNVGVAHGIAVGAGSCKGFATQPCTSRASYRAYSFLSESTFLPIDTTSVDWLSVSFHKDHQEEGAEANSHNSSGSSFPPLDKKSQVHIRLTQAFLASTGNGGGGDAPCPIGYMQFFLMDMSVYWIFILLAYVFYRQGAERVQSSNNRIASGEARSAMRRVAYALWAAGIWEFLVAALSCRGPLACANSCDPIYVISAAGLGAYTIYQGNQLKAVLDEEQQHERDWIAVGSSRPT